MQKRLFAGKGERVVPRSIRRNWYVYCGNDPVNYVDLLGLDAAVATQLIQQSANIHPAIALVPLAIYANYYIQFEAPRAIGQAIGDKIFGDSQKRTLSQEEKDSIKIGNLPFPTDKSIEKKVEQKTEPEPEQKSKPTPKTPSSSNPLPDDDDDEEEVILYRGGAVEDNKDYDENGNIRSWAMRHGFDPYSHTLNIGSDEILGEHSFSSENISSPYISTTDDITHAAMYAQKPDERIYVFKVTKDRFFQNPKNEETENLIYGPIHNSEILGYIEGNEMVYNPNVEMEVSDYFKIQNDMKKLCPKNNY